MLREILDYLFYVLFGLDSGNRIVQVIDFFIYDSIKIIFLLFIMIGLLGYIRTYIPVSRLKEIFVKRRILGSFGASVFGALTPFCSCSSIPIFLSFVRAKVPIGAAFAFIITSPLVNEYLVVLMFAEFGIKITIAYVLSGIIIGVIAGNLIQLFGGEKYIIEDLSGPCCSGRNKNEFKSYKDRIRFGIKEANDIVKKLWGWVLLGVGIGAVIHGLVPSDFIQSTIAKAGFFDVPIAAILGVPLYASCAAIVPVAVVLFDKGVPLGTALAFMMGTSALSFPEAVILKRAMKTRLIIMFFVVVTIGIIFTGYLFNFLQYTLI